MRKRFLIAAAIVLIPFVSIGAFATNTYLKTLSRAKEVVLQQNLWTMRRGIDFFTKDRGVRPYSLNELVSTGYLREIPKDPFTKSNQTWVVDEEKAPPNSCRLPGVSGVHSDASGADANGKAYNQY